MGKTKKWEKLSGLHNGAIKELQIGADFSYKSGQEGFQIGANRLEIGAGGISNRGKEDKLVQNSAQHIYENIILLGDFNVNINDPCGVSLRLIYV